MPTEIGLCAIPLHPVNVSATAINSHECLEYMAVHLVLDTRHLSATHGALPASLGAFIHIANLLATRRTSFTHFGANQTKTAVSR
jgi:hypothetical protein